MPYVRMVKTTEKPPRKAGKLYDVPSPENWHLVRDRLAVHEYVPESKQEGIPESDAAASRAAFKRSTRKPK